MKTDKHALFQKRANRITRINQGQNEALEPRRARRVIRILRANHAFLWSLHPDMSHPGKGYRRALSRYS
jgi:hypothetical protein